MHQKRQKSRFLQKDISARLLWGLCAAAAIGKIVLCSFQYMYASPDLSPIDDTLMFELAKSITAGNWLGKYDWLILSKHSFFALWLAFLNAIHLNVLVGGQILFAGACFVLLAATKPAFKTNLARLWLFGITLFTPATWAEYSLRIYRDNIYPALVLYLVAGLLGAFLRYRQAPRKAIGYYIVAGFAMGAAWLTHEDNALLLPFLFCASAVYLLFVFFGKFQKREKLAKAGLLLLPFLLWGACVSAWCGMNDQYYGRFIVSDFTSSEFNDAMGAMSRVCIEDQQQYNLIPYATRQKLYQVSPALNSIEPYLETEEIYNGYGSAKTKEIGSGGIHWAIRKAAWRAGYYADAKTSERFYRQVAAEINEACDKGLLPAGPKRSGTFAVFKKEYLAPTFQKFGEQVKIMAFFEQTGPTAELSIARPDQSEDWESYLHCTSTKAAVENTKLPYFPGLNLLAYRFLDLCTSIQRIVLWPMLALAALWFVRMVRELAQGIKKKALPQDLLDAILFVGIGLTALLRMAAVAYLMAVSFSIRSYLMYLSAACPLMLCFFAYASSRWLEKRFRKNEL